MGTEVLHPAERDRVDRTGEGSGDESEHVSEGRDSGTGKSASLFRSVMRHSSAMQWWPTPTSHHHQMQLFYFLQTDSKVLPVPIPSEPFTSAMGMTGT